MASSAATTGLSGDPLAARAAVDLVRFTGLVAQLVLLLLAIWGLKVESPIFLTLSTGCFLAFVVHYFTPFAWKKHAFVVLSLLVGLAILVQRAPHPDFNLFVLLPPIIFLGFAVALGLVMFGCLRLPIPFWLRVCLLLSIAGGLAFVRDRTGSAFLPDLHWSILGALFMFRMIVYAYDVAVARAPEKLVDFLSYFFLLPNFCFVVFPVVDYSTFKKSYYADDIHSTAQRGIVWMVRGTIHLCLYRLVYHRLSIPSHDVHSFATLCQFVLPSYLLYLRISGSFHIIVGMLHLFGYKLPETNRKFLLANGPTDFWRRINIYWKDFMIKVFYYPVYFRFRKMNSTVAIIVATAVVFLATSLLHAYQWFWLSGLFELRMTDIVFWTILGVTVMIAVVYESRRGRPKPKPRGQAAVQRVLTTLGWYLFISVVWSMWSSYSITEWIDTVQYWR